MKEADRLAHQAVIFTKYLISKQPNTQSITLYSRAIAQGGELDGYDLKLLSFVQRHPFWVGCVDGGLALVNPHSEVRRRIYVMFAILESQPVFWRDFLPIKQNRWYIFFILFTGLRAIIRAVTGIVIVKAIGVSSK